MSAALEPWDDDGDPVFVECHFCGEVYISEGYDTCPHCTDQEADE
jgi:hypothetical protein